MLKLTIPDWVGAGYYPKYLDNAPNISISHGKIATTHVYTQGFANSVMHLKGFSHLASLGPATVDEKNKRCFTVLANFRESNDDISHNPNETSARNFANAVAGNFTKNSVFVDEFMEGAGAIYNANYFVVANWFYNQLCQQLGSSGQSDNNFFGIYMDPYSNLIGNSFNPPNSGRNPTASFFTGKLASQAEARKDRSGNTHGYFSSGMYQWSNLVTSSYYSGEAINNDYLFRTIAEIQVKYAAMSSIKTIVYNWTGAQSVTTELDNWSGSDGWEHPRTGGAWLSKSFAVNLPYNILASAFFGFVMAEGYYGWDATLTLSRDETKMKDNYFPGRVNWVSTGGSQPALLPFDSSEPGWPLVPYTAEDLVVVAMNWWNTIKPYVEASTGLAYASYTRNGQQVSIRPGDPRLFRRGFTNYGQDTILYHAAAERGGAFACQGNGQTVVIYTNPYLTVAETEDIVVSFNGENFNLGSCAGATLYVQLFPTNDTPTVPPIANGFSFITNTTGYFDSDDFVDKITSLAPTSRVVRWCVRWDEYEIAPGVYATSKLQARKNQIDAIYAAQGLAAPVYAVNFWGVRHANDITDFIPYNDVVVFQNGVRAEGNLVGNGTYGLGSFSSTAYRTRVANCGTSITNWFNQNAPGRFFYGAFSTGQTEEFYNYLLDAPGGGNFDSHGDFSATALASWRGYLVETFGATTPWGETSATASLPTAEWNTYGQPWVVSVMLGTEKGKEWAKWTSREMDATVMAFRDAVKAANANVFVIHFIADFYRDQANGWLVNAPSTFPIVAKLDGLYHSDGDMADDGDFAKKYSSFDCMVPTWGADKLYFCEMDYKDMYMYGSGPPDKDAIKRVARAVYRKGGAGVHYAMSVTASQGAVINEANAEILQEIANGTLTRLNRTGAPTYQFNLSPMVFGGNSQLLNAYKNTYGGTETNVVNVQLINNI